MQTLTIVNSKNIVINGLSSVNSQMFHIVINGCENVFIQGVMVTASANSPNTDGIHVQLSTGITIMSSGIKTGDDCISIGPGTTNLWIEHVACGPGHGISIGSLAKDLEEEGVQNVTVKTAIFNGTQNGLRIKSWGRDSRGFVKDVLFTNIVMKNVYNPIIIDQNYCPRRENCPDQVSGVKISNVTYKDIQGTSATQVALKFDCSPKNPCEGIRLDDVKLTYLNQTAQSSCTNASGVAYGLVDPTSCF
ncbi:PREDICTED: polygalacturonase-like [Nelumbo nucifera]|uniref:Polygalacturonase-like n=1 Tax=Nelumbo nucifera TaxID=4432 RepID=A0A1U7Z7A5_NELNU|nr:PREDICTED: polygalacturonase-like [Nelumbo nucifera]